MKHLMNLPLTAAALSEFQDISAFCGAMGLDGLEGVWGGEALPLEQVPASCRVGYHLTFWPDWLDFWRGDEDTLTRKFGSSSAWTSFYGGEDGRETLLAAYRADLDRALQWGAEYVVFHVSDVSLEECYTYRWEHSHQEVLDAAIEVVNLLLDGRDWPFAFLMENQWWPGLTLTDRALTQRLLDGVHYENKGLLLDTGHLMNANSNLTTAEEGVAWMHRVLDRLGDLRGHIRAVHLHQSLSGSYVRAAAGRLPALWTEEHDYFRKFGVSYEHILQIDTHSPFTCPAIVSVLDRIGPSWLTHELSAPNRAVREAAVRAQKETLRKGWESH